MGRRSQLVFFFTVAQEEGKVPLLPLNFLAFVIFVMMLTLISIQQCQRGV